MSASRRSTPGLLEFLEEADLSRFYNEVRSSLRVSHVQQLKYVGEDDLMSVGMSKPEVRRLRTCYQKYCPPNYVGKLKRLLLPMWSKDEYLLDADESSSTAEIPSPPASSGSKTMPLNNTVSIMEVEVAHQRIIRPESISICKELGTGEFGVVQQGFWRDENNESHAVAIKSLSKERMQNSTLQFMKEYEIMQNIEHENIVKLHGVVLDNDQKIMIITELAPMRSLLECLKEPSMRPMLTVPCITRFAEQIASGMHYLETKRLIHRDLAARNILVFSPDLVKVTDFGLSRALGVGKDYYQTNFNLNLKLPIAWCAPECITFLKFTSASDVWAFGVTLWEMFNYGSQPWASYTGQQILEAIDEPNYRRLDRPAYCPEKYFSSVMLQCWRHDPLARPTFGQLSGEILQSARPDQVRATVRSDPSADSLLFGAGTVITVLDNSNSMSWRGVRDDNAAMGNFCPSKTALVTTTTASCPAKSSSASKPIRKMGHAIGYIRKSNPASLLASNPTASNVHEYHCISDAEDEEDFFKPLDLGPSLLDEVFGELEQKSTSKAGETDRKKDLKDLVSSTLNLTGKRNKKKLATVKPINASDAKALDSAIAMANALASKSMHDLDKRTMFFDNTPPLTPNSPTKKFASFFFPSASSGSCAGTAGRARPFSEAARAAGDIENALSSQEIDAYKELVDSTPSAKLSPSMPLLVPLNPLPLPPKKSSGLASLSQPKKRHVRKNPLILPTATVSNMIRNEAGSCHAEALISRPDDDAFEAALEQNMAALDAIAIGGPTGDEETRNIDEVRIMMKVMGRAAHAEECLRALNLTQWNIHHAIKLVKLKSLIKADIVSEGEMIDTLSRESWDLARAASIIMKKL